MSFPAISGRRCAPSPLASAVSDSISDDSFSDDSLEFGPLDRYDTWLQFRKYVTNDDVRIRELPVNISVHERPSGNDSLLEEASSLSSSACMFVEVLQFSDPEHLNDVDERSQGLISHLIISYFACKRIGGRTSLQGGEQGAKLKALLRKGADPNLMVLGEPALVFCIIHEIYDIAVILIEGGADPMQAGRLGRNAIHAASWRDKDFILEEIGSRWPVDWGYRSQRERCSAIEMAVFSESTSAILFLGRQGRVNVDHLSAEGLGLIHLAAELGKVSSIRALRKAGADLGARGENGMTALHLAALSDHPDAVRELLRLKKDLSRVKDAKRRTPFDLARTPETIEAFRDGQQADDREFKGSGEGQEQGVSSMRA